MKLLLKSKRYRPADTNRARAVSRLREAGIAPDRDLQVSGEVDYQRFKTELSGQLQAVLSRAQEMHLSRERLSVWLRGLLHDAYKQAFTMGLKAAGWEGKPEDADHLWLGEFTHEEDTYLNGFLDDFYSGKGKMPYVQRLAMYAKSVDAVFWAGKLSGNADDVVIRWNLSPAEHCEDCLRLAGQSPYTKKTLPFQPRSGHTECLSNCQCYLTFEHPPVKPAIQFPLSVSSDALTEADFRNVEFKIAEYEHWMAPQLQRLEENTQSQLAALPFPSRSYNLTTLALWGILLAWGRKREEDNSRLIERYINAGVLPLGDLHHPSEFWTVVPAPGGWAARSSGRTLGVFSDKQDAYQFLLTTAKHAGRVVPSSLETAMTGLLRYRNGTTNDGTATHSLPVGTDQLEMLGKVGLPLLVRTRQRA